MKYFRFALVVFALALEVAHAQDEERRAPPTEIPDFSNLDEYIYEPKSTVTFGFRRLSGAKTSFSGTGTINSPDDPGAATGANLNRIYHDGSVRPDARMQTRLDTSGNPVVDPQTGIQITDPIAPDGKTNSWNFLNGSQTSEVPGFVAMHTYSAEVVDTLSRQQSGNTTNGLDLAVTRDMGKLFGTRITWNLVAGMSVNDISAKTFSPVAANLVKITDLYSLYGQTAPEAPYSGPTTTSQNVLDPSGNPVLNDDGTNQTTTVDNTVLLANEPSGRTTSTTLGDTTSVTNRWKVKGAYYTFRAGPQLWVPVTTRLRASITLGPAIVYSGTNYTVTQTFTPESGGEISVTDTSAAYKLLPGYYADATVQFDLTERAGFYAGAVFQSAGNYTQRVESTTAHYATKIDLSNQNGVRAGMSIRF